MALFLFGIRHHGPGCARALIAALNDLKPDILLIEGPPEGEEYLDCLTDPDIKPPVAMLIYPADQPQDAVFYPYAVFSPEWNALLYAKKNGIPIRMIDLPLKNRFALNRKQTEDLEKTFLLPLEKNKMESELEDSEKPEDEIENTVISDDRTQNSRHESDRTLAEQIRVDPLSVLARAAGYEEDENWWELVIEQSKRADGVFQGILEAMTELRVTVLRAEEDGEPNSDSNKSILLQDRPAQEYEKLREASMRRIVRESIRSGYERIAVVCGAWHVPVLDLETKDEQRRSLVPTKKQDDALLSGLPKLKTRVTWAPWTFSRIASRNGYGAGIESPGWFNHLWHYPENSAAIWLTRSARLLRRNGFDVSAANVIEAVRLAEALASIRHRPAPGLLEMNDAILSVLCQGNPHPWELVREKLEIGSEIGTVPKNVPVVPLQSDIEKEQKRLRMKVTDEVLELDLDLRKENDRAKSRLLHRLRLLNINWGTPGDSSRHPTGTFHEYWQLQWKVEFIVQIIESSVLGNTLETAAAGSVEEQLTTIDHLPKVTKLLERSIPAELPSSTMECLFLKLQNCAALSNDIGGQLSALPPLVQIIRYGNVRQTDRLRIEPLFYALFERVLVGLVSGSLSLDETAAENRVAQVNEVQMALQTLAREKDLTAWLATLAQLIDNDSIHGLLSGRCCRILYEQGVLSPDELSIKLGLFVSPTRDPGKVAEWLQGFLKGPGQTLIHLDAVWNILNVWLCMLSDEVFMELLPLLRRSFSEFSPPELRIMGDRIRNLTLSKGMQSVQSDVKKTDRPELAEDRIAKLIPVLNAILGISKSDCENNISREGLLFSCQDVSE